MFDAQRGIRRRRAKEKREGSNALLCELLKAWEIDGDIMRCKACGNGIVASRMDEVLKHKEDCSYWDKGENGGNPWIALSSLLQELRIFT